MPGPQISSMIAIAAAILLATPALAAAKPAPHVRVVHQTASHPSHRHHARPLNLSAAQNSRTAPTVAQGPGWTQDPSDRQDDQATGVGWRENRSTVLLGYEPRGPTSDHPYYGPQIDRDRWARQSGVTGVNLTFRPH